MPAKPTSGKGKVPLTTGRLRSAISNGRRILLDVDARGPEMRRLRDLVEAHASDLGGVANLSQGQRTLIARCAMLTVLCEMAEQGFANVNRFKVGGDELKAHLRALNSLRRCLEAIGLERKARDVTPSLNEYIEKTYPSEAAE